MGYDIGIMICDFDYYISFIDCVIWLLILDRIDGKDWKEDWKKMEVWWRKMGRDGVEVVRVGEGGVV